MATKKKQEKGTGAIVAGGGLTAYGAANAPVLRVGSKDMSRMANASPKRQGARYQAELHQAMQSGKVKTDSPVHVLRTPSGRHVNAGGTHRHIARQAMGKPSKYEVKNISHELHVSPAQKVSGKLRVAGLQRGSKRAEAGKRVKPVGTRTRAHNRVMAAAADAGDAKLWSNPAALKGPATLQRKAGLLGAGVIAGTGAAMTAVGLRDRKEWKKKTQPVRKARVMSDTEIRHRKKVQGKVSQATGALGLAALGGTLAASPAGRGVLRRVPKVRNRVAAPPPKDPNRDRIKAGVTPLLATSAGLGGLGAFNFAAYTSAESRKKKPVIKRDEQTLEMGFYGEEGHPVKLPEITVPIEKAWSPSVSNFDPERKREKRSKVYQSGLAVGGAGATGGAGYAAAKAGKLELKNRTKGQVKAAGLPRVKAAQAVRHAGAVKHGKAAAVLGAAGAAGLGGSALVGRQRKKSWQSYSKRDATSAFGVDHGPDSEDPTW